MSPNNDRTQLKVLRSSAQTQLTAAYESFILSQQAAHRSERTIDFYHEKLRPFVMWLEERGVTHVTGIMADHIRTYLLEQERAGRKPLTVHHHAQAIKTFCNFLVSEELLSASPMRKVKMPKVDQEILPAPNPEHVRKLLA